MNDQLENLGETFEMELPKPKVLSLDGYLDEVLSQIRPMSEDLREVKYYVAAGGKPWLEIRDDPGFQEQVLHFFNEGGEYLQSVDGNVSRGKWRLLDGTNKIIIEQGGGGDKNPSRTELFELSFLNQYFFILNKHGDQTRKGGRKYYMMGFEPAVKGLKWKDCVELLYNEYRSQWGAFQWLIIGGIIIIAIVLLMSLF